MKKVFLTLKVAMFFVAFTVFFTMCRKDGTPQNLTGRNSIKSSENDNLINYTYNGIVKVNDFLHISNKSIFYNTLELLDTLEDQQLNSWENSLNFNSYRKHYNVLEDAQDDQSNPLRWCDDDALATLINKDGLIAIDSCAFLLDFENDKIYELYPITPNNITLLKQKTLVNNDSMYIMEYSLKDEVLNPDGYELVQERTINNQNSYLQGNKRAFKWLKKFFHKIGLTNSCSDNNTRAEFICSGSDGPRCWNEYEYSSETNNTIKFKYCYKLKYHQAGLRHKIKLKVKHYKKVGEDNWKKNTGYVCVAYFAKSIKMCETNINSEQTICTAGIQGAPSTYNSTKYKKTIYSGLTRLSKYKVKAYFTFFKFEQNKPDYESFGVEAKEIEWPVGNSGLDLGGF